MYLLTSYTSKSNTLFFSLMDLLFTFQSFYLFSKFLPFSYFAHYTLFRMSIHPSSTIVQLPVFYPLQCNSSRSSNTSKLLRKCEY